MSIYIFFFHLRNSSQTLLGLYCYNKTLWPKQLVHKAVYISSHNNQIIPLPRGKSPKELKKGTWRQELNERPGRNAVCWFVLQVHVKLTYTSQDGLRNGLANISDFNQEKTPTGFPEGQFDRNTFSILIPFLHFGRPNLGPVKEKPMLLTWAIFPAPIKNWILRGIVC